jgi:hypothetical protein
MHTPLLWLFLATLLLLTLVAEMSWRAHFRLVVPARGAHHDTLPFAALLFMLSSHPRRKLRPLAGMVRGLAELASVHAAGHVVRTEQALLGTGEHGAPITDDPRETVLLFYEDVERDRWVRGDRHVRRSARRVYHALTQGQTVSGFEVAFRMLCIALQRAGCRVVVNNRRLARRNPTHPVGICGYSHILDHWSLPNPAVIGPGLYNHPGEAPNLMDDGRIRAYLLPCEWVRDLFLPVYGPRCGIWYAGIDLDRWPDTSSAPKDIDLLVYEKLLWDRDLALRDAVAPVLAEIDRRGMHYVVVRRGAYGPEEYRALLARSRAMLFLCQHETQGLAYLEALASNVPVLAWDPGVWLDPIRLRYDDRTVPATSVPYFSPECGERFRGAAEFPEVLDRFFARLPQYTPRAYVAEQCSLERSAEMYLTAYRAARTTTTSPHA